MSVATLYNLPLDPTSMVEWSFSNSASHMEIIAAISAKYQVQLTPYVLDPLPTDDIPSFLLRHQQMHADMAGVTGIGTNNYTAIDFNDPVLLRYYLDLHAAEHVTTHAFLGIVG
jgi:hypothetical protein